MGCSSERRQLSDVPVATLWGWDWEIFIPILLTASKVDSSKLWAAWGGVIFIISQMDCEYICCFLQGCRPSTHTGSGMAGAFTMSPYSTSAKFAVRKRHFYLR